MEEIEQLKEENKSLKEKFSAYETQIETLTREKAEKEKLLTQLAKQHEDIMHFAL